MKIIARLLVCLGVVVSTSSGQSYSDLRGISPFHSYDFTDTDTVELSHGNVILNVPIVSYKQKGQLPPFEVKLVYNAKNWEFSQQVTDVGGNDYYYIWDMNAITVNPYNGVILPRPNGVQLVTGKTYDINWMVGNTNPVDPNAGFSYIGYRLDDNASGSRPMAKVTGPDLSFAALDASGLTFVSPTYFSMDAS